jgi:hypothetical protein
MLDAVAPDCLTPISTIVAAYDQFLSDDNQQTGEAMECSADKHFLISQTEYANGRVSKRAATVWEPLFKMMHSEMSNISDAIP